MATSECESNWLQDMNNLAESSCLDTSMDVEVEDKVIIKDVLPDAAYRAYAKSLHNPQWIVYTRQDALYSRLGLPLECYPFTRRTPSAYANLLDQVRKNFVTMIVAI